MTLLHHSPRNAGSSGNGHTFSFILTGNQFTLRTDHSSLQWLQKFKNEDGMLARWYLLLGQFSVTFEYRPGSLHSNADGMSRQCGQCRRPDCPVSAADLPAVKAETQSLLIDQPWIPGCWPGGVNPLCIRKTGHLWQVVISGLCTVEDRTIDIF